MARSNLSTHYLKSRDNFKVARRYSRGLNNMQTMYYDAYTYTLKKLEVCFVEIEIASIKERERKKRIKMDGILYVGD